MTLVSPEDQGTIMVLLNIQQDIIVFVDVNMLIAQTQGLIVRVVKILQPIRKVQVVCKHPQQMDGLQPWLTDLHSMQSWPPRCNHTEFVQWIMARTRECDQARIRPAAPRSDMELRQELLKMIQHPEQSGKNAHSVRMHLANPSKLAARADPASPQATEDRGHQFPNSLNSSGSDQTQLRTRIAQDRMVIQ
jgi:hypothetical protein